MKLLQNALTVLLITAAQLCSADWQLNNEQSSISMVTTKATHIAEVHQFTEMSGGIGKEGAEITINLASINSNIPLRDQRIRDILFETARFPSATFVANVDMAATNKLAVGQQLSQNITGSLSLYGQKQNLDLGPVTVTRLADNRLMVTNILPVVVNAGSFNLAAGVEKLRALAGLPSISNAVPVNFQLVFEK